MTGYLQMGRGSARVRFVRAWVVGAMLGLVAASAVAQDGPTAVVAMESGGENFKTLMAVPNQWCGTPSISPDGKTLLYDMSPPKASGVTHLFTARLDRPDESPKDLGPGYAPAWSPEGDRIAFYMTSNNRDGVKKGIWVMHADGTGRTWLCEGRWARFSPDGNRVLFADKPLGQGDGIFALDLRTDEIMPLLDQPYTKIAGGGWSPDGKRVCVVVRHSNNDGELLIVNSEGEDRTAVSRLKADLGWRPDWSPDGKHVLLWIRKGDDHNRLHLVEVDSAREPQELAHQESTFNSDAVFSPDGKQIMWIRD